MCSQIDFSEVSLLIIAGGQSSRMRQDKRLIKIGQFTLLENILSKASKENFAAIFLCVEEKLKFIEELATKYNAKILVDNVQCAGPLTGLTEGLKNIKTQWALAVSCDMPFFEFAAVRPLLNELGDESKVILPIVGGKRQPLTALYNKSLAGHFEEELLNGQRKIFLTIEKVSHKFVELDDEIKFFNANTPADLRLALGREANSNRKVPIISIIAPASGTGKTTFIEKLIKKLTPLRVGVIKSDAHGFNLDVEGKDSYKFQQAGAIGVAVVSPNGWFITQKTDERADFSRIADKFDDVDLILTESRTHGTRPAISMYRGIREPLITDDVVALFTNKKFDTVEGIAQYDLDDIDQAVKLIKFLKGGKYES